MLHERRRSVTRRAALAMLPWLWLAAATSAPGCSPAGQASSGAERTPDRLKKMRARRGTGDPRRQGERSSTRAQQKSGSR
jgi:hypothetical protein